MNHSEVADICLCVVITVKKKCFQLIIEVWTETVHRGIIPFIRLLDFLCLLLLFPLVYLGGGLSMETELFWSKRTSSSESDSLTITEFLPTKL